MKKLALLYFLTTFNLQAQCTFKSVSMGAYKVTALCEDQTLLIWGGVGLDQQAPSQIGTDSDWVMIRTGASHTVGIKLDGTLWAWGNNTYGQLGIPYNPNNNLSLPTQVGTDSDWKYICTGNSHTAAVKNNGTLWTWGRNAYGQLGNGTWTDVETPTQVGTATDWETVECTLEMMVGLKSDHTIWSWGNNEFGGLGDGTTIARNTPAQIGTDTDWETVKASRYHCLALKNDGTLWGWGINTFGQLGDGTTTDKHTPIQIGLENDWNKIATGEHHTLAIKDDGSLWSWGGNDFGQLGIGNTLDQHLPVQIGTDTDWNNFGTGTYNSFALKSNGICWLWGRNNSFQLLDYTNNQPYATSPLLFTCALGTASFSPSKIILYPNPVADIVHLQKSEIQLIKKANIYSNSGQLIRTTNSVSDQISVSDLSAGFYFIMLEMDTEIKHLKFIKE